MNHKHAITADKIGKKVALLRRFAEDVRDLPPLSVSEAQEHLDRHRGDAARARQNLAGLVGPIAPHERRIGDDSHITGKVGGLDRRQPWRRHKVKSIWIDDPDHVARIRYNVAIIRPGRPVNARGSSSIHFSFEAIDKAQLELGLPNAQGQKVSPREHVIYIERAEALADYIQSLKNFAPAQADDYVRYQERADALAQGEEGFPSQAVFTNIPGTTADHAAFFSRLGEMARIDCEPSIELDLKYQSPFMREIRSRLGITAASAISTSQPLIIKGADVAEWLPILRKIGWRDKRTKAEKQNRQFDSDGVRHDPGKSDTVQCRLVGELPWDIDHEGRIRIVQGLCKEFEDRRLPYVAVIHAPGPENNDRNWHFHLVYHDRPVSVFDGTEATHVFTTDANGKIPVKKVDLKRHYLTDPAVQAQVGKWDFDVAAIKVRKRQRFTIFPYRQRKNRDVTRVDWIPSLRAKLCELTNAEFERAEIERRVDPLPHHKAGRRAVAGKKLGAMLMASELSGIPTERGMSNEHNQWFARREQLEEEYQFVFCRDYVPLDEKKLIYAAFVDRNKATGLIMELEALRREKAELAHHAKVANELIDRLTSRPRAVEERTLNRRIGETGHKKPRQNVLAALDRQASHAREHIAAMKLLGGDLFQIGRDVDRKIAAIETRIAAIEREAGLRSANHFEIDPALAEQSTGQPTVERPATRRPAQGEPAAEQDPVQTRQAVVEQPESLHQKSRETISEDLDVSLQHDAARQAGQSHSTKLPDRPIDPVSNPNADAAPAQAEVRAPERAADPAPERASDQPSHPITRSTPTNSPRPKPTTKTNQDWREHARRRQTSQYLDRLWLAGVRVPFALGTETIDGQVITVAIIDPVTAKRENLPERIEARTPHEQSRLKGIAAYREASAINDTARNDPQSSFGRRMTTEALTERPLTNSTEKTEPEIGYTVSARSAPAPLAPIELQGLQPLQDACEIPASIEGSLTQSSAHEVKQAASGADLPAVVGSGRAAGGQNNPLEDDQGKPASIAEITGNSARRGTANIEAQVSPNAESGNPRQARPQRIPNSIASGQGATVQSDRSTEMPSARDIGASITPGPVADTTPEPRTFPDVMQPPGSDLERQADFEPVGEQQIDRKMSEQLAPASNDERRPAQTVIPGSVTRDLAPQSVSKGATPALDRSGINVHGAVKPIREPVAELPVSADGAGASTTTGDAENARKDAPQKPVISREALDAFNQVCRDVAARRLFLWHAPSGRIAVRMDDRDLPPDFGRLWRTDKAQKLLKPHFERQEKELGQIAEDLVLGRVRPVQTNHGPVMDFEGYSEAIRRLEPWMHNRAFQRSLSFVFSLQDLRGKNVSQTMQICDGIRQVLGGSADERNTLMQLTGVKADSVSPRSVGSIGVPDATAGSANSAEQPSSSLTADRSKTPTNSMSPARQMRTDRYPQGTHDVQARERDTGLSRNPWD